MGELARHLDHIHLVVADDAQVLDQTFGIDHLAAAHDLRQVGIESCVTQTHRRRRDRRDYDAGGSGGDLPQRGGASFLDLGMRREILERQHIIGRQTDDRFGQHGAGQLAERAHDRQQLIQSAVVGNGDDQRPRGATMQQGIEKSFAGGSESGHTNPPRAALDLGNSTRKGGRLFHVRKEFADEREDHRLFSLPAKAKAAGRCPALVRSC